MADTIIFLDVDGVLNKSWHDATAETIDLGDCCSVCKKACPLDQQLLRALVDLFVRIASDDELGQPKLVLSTTWRLYSRRQALLQRHLEASGLVCSGPDSCLHEAPHTPDLGHGTTSEGRNAEITAWLGERLEKPRLFIALDDLHVLFSAAGRAISSPIREVNFVHTIDDGGVASDVGLTAARVEVALSKLRAQAAAAKREAGTGRWTQDEWEVLKTSGALPMSLLSKDTCPDWILDRARAYLKAERDGSTTRRRMCTCC